MNRRALGLLAALLLAVVAVATPADPRGWTPGGTPAASAERFLAGVKDAEPIELPEAVAPLIKKPTLLVYFSPTCPHCMAVAPEMSALAKRLGKKAQLLGVAHARATQPQIDAFAREYGWTFKIITDADSAVAMAMGARGTPAALLVRPSAAAKGKFDIVDAWYPYSRGTDTLVEMRLAADPWSVFRPNEYKGNRTCAACHEQEMDAWSLSFHAVAWNTLEKKGDHTKAECVSCHVTGAGQPTGWVGSAEGHDHHPLADVGCEACHGPGGPHDGVKSEPAQACASCHDDKHSIAFTYEKGLPLIDHYKAVGMGDAAWQEARSALWRGEVPRDLLAFAEGPTVGSQACAGCHPEEHKSWATGPHGRAMETLAKIPVVAPEGEVAPAGPHQNAECVRCHATPKEIRGGAPSTDLAAYRHDEGVSCESCHGPGAAHVAAGGGKDNIEGLGESCPVCVLEAICTSCHTPQWDKGWELETRLVGARHAATPAEKP